ncbi:MAG TPA: hypothetical protein VGY56_19780 [Verrucomicrobiae bacterium]|nr:hypothetical protein [Verrucomicrobiae bacterium]
MNTSTDVAIYITGNVSTRRNAMIYNGANYAKAFSIYDLAGCTILSISIHPEKSAKKPGRNFRCSFGINR